MMPRLVLLAALASLVALFIDFTRVGPGQDRTAPADAPPGSYYLRDAHVTEWGPDGRVRLEVEAAEAVHDARQDAVQLNDVRLDYFAAPGRNWRVTARQGAGPAGFQTVELSGDVVMTGRQEAQRAQTVVRTERLVLEPEARRAHTDQPVTLVFGQYALAATGLQADLNAATLRLESAVHGRFLP